MEIRKFVVFMVLVGMALALAAGVGVVLADGPEPQAALGTAFTYQGQLEKGGSSVDGDCDMDFRLYNAASGGSQVGSATITTVPVEDGLFTVELDFGGSAFQGDARWLGIKVKGPGDADYNDLGRQELTAAPYALHALSAGDADTLDGQHGSYYRSAININAGTLGNGYFCAYSDLSAEGYLGDASGDLARNNGVVQNNLNADKLDGQHGSYYRSASNINAGTLANGYFSAYSDLSAEGKIGSGSSQVAAGHHTHFGQTWSGSGLWGLFVSNGTSSGTTDGVYGKSASTSGRGLYGYASASSGTTYGVYGLADSTSGRGLYGSASASSGTTHGVYGQTASGSGYGGFFVNTGSGTRYLLAANDSSTISDLEFKVSNSGNVFADGAYYGAGGVFLGSADFAEMMLPGQADLAPGDVLCIGPDGRMVRSTEAYQSSVVGVYSTQPGLVAGHKWDEDGNPLEPERIPLAVLGVVPTKASAENGSIQPGDLLVASSTPGHAMKAGPNPPVGTVIGKALEGLDTGTGVIQTLVMLQ